MKGEAELPRIVSVADNAHLHVSYSVNTKVHLWWTWLRIAARHVGQARRARAGQVTAGSFEAPSSAALSQEFEAALVAIASVAFAMEALDKELKSSGHILDESQFSAPIPTNRGFYVAQRLAQAFGIAALTVSTLESELVSAFELRNGSAHFDSEPRDGVHPHPSGTNTAFELTVYTLERAEALVRFGRDVISEGALATAEGRLFSGATELARELPEVLKMLDEVMASEGF